MDASRRASMASGPEGRRESVASVMTSGASHEPARPAPPSAHGRAPRTAPHAGPARPGGSVGGGGREHERGESLGWSDEVLPASRLPTPAARSRGDAAGSTQAARRAPPQRAARPMPLAADGARRLQETLHVPGHAALFGRRSSAALALQRLRARWQRLAAGAAPVEPGVSRRAALAPHALAARVRPPRRALWAQIVRRVPGRLLA